MSSYLITNDGELLGCSTRNDNYMKNNVSVNEDAGTNSKIISNSPITVTDTWEDMDPSDIGALVAEVVDDYRRLGLELALLSPIIHVGAGGNSGEKGTIAVDGSSSGMKSETSNSSDVQRKKSSAKDRGRLNCLIIELEKGLVGIATATSTTYVVALTDSTAQHGLLKMKLTALAGYVREQFLPLGE
mmetsp:Transcript_22946/g.34975  ORF Transcript_22946/g.34975 Transcript_22946/m.34975 type:complete len:187 (+) Transcript_22946:183-743(+)|eukprot:CAMPEP_0194123266 /NCGR_PEP_ID=MMETSP0150-20130528/53750_1 /TAXON_ID=122233 /ORGANISM="Chaetoceros debilis, Strain MM31A-1" /LENGTH=186 /DNA_ID=CAMNT_0038816429 /DNA_START=85 /DNA_END=645 /DNA_ORIENTATION=+